ncbi:phage tail protein [Tenacibaculum ovolyticum]|uniref:phage tail protein n=1 Tax=Tenacibaculum ovolyticum TaxID=104270 RepID=UPI000417A54D|nr:hypothetical protein [Tenacibaculum ovolyticum]
MFTAKKNKTQPSTSLKNKGESPFIKPKMKVVKPENKKGTVKSTPKKEQAVNKLNTHSSEVDKENKETNEGVNKLSESKKTSKDVGLKTLNVAGVKEVVSSTTKPVKGSNYDSQTIKSKKEVKERSDKEKDIKKEGDIVKNKIPKAPIKPEDDPAFKKQIKVTEKVKEEKSKHPEPATKVGEQKEAGRLGVEVQSVKNDQKAHADSLSATSEQEKKRAPFTPESFKELLKNNLDDLEKKLPKNSEEAEKFKEEKPIERIKENISGQVTSESDKLAGPMKNEADKPAPVTGAPILEVKALPVTNPGIAPKPLNAKAISPKSKTSQEISMEKESQSLDNEMSENNVTDEQLAKSNEPKFTGALEQKNQAQVEAKLAPVTYRKKEEAQLGTAQNKAATSSREGLDQMQGAKQLSENNVLASQTTNKTSDKTAQEKIFAEFQEIYEETKKTVTESLEKLSEDVDKKFSEEAESAQITFEKNVEDGLGQIYGWTVIDDWIFGEDTEAIDKLFIIEKGNFVAKMNSVLDAISIIIADGLNGALDTIDVGKKKSKEKFDNLDASQKKLGEEAFNDFNDQYADLENTVYEKQDELASDLAQSYKENIDSLQAKFDEIKESVSAGWIGGALNALKGVIETIKKLRDLIANLLAEIQNAMDVIIKDPIGFVATLFEGVGKGIDMFMANIQKHMLGGFVTWLTGAMGPVGITIPDNLFSLKGIFSLVMQVLGLSWDFVREKSVLLMGEPMVTAMEKGFEMFQIIREKGVSGIWEHIKEQFTDLKETIIESIKSMLITQVIEAGIKWLLSLLIPGAGFIKAIMAIKDLIVFFVESAIMLIPSLIKAIKSLASGNVAGVAKAIEKGLAMLLPLVISLFAKLIGLGGLVKKVQKIVEKVRKRIDRAVTKMIKKAKKKFNKILGKNKPKKGQAKKIKEDNKNQKPDILTTKDKAKHKKIIVRIEKKLGTKANKGEPFDKFHARKKKEAKTLENKYQPQLKKGINLDIKFNELTKDQKDNDVDINIKIAPNTSRGSVQSPGDGDSTKKIHDQVKEDFKSKAHSKIIKKQQKSLDSILEKDKKIKDGRKRIRSYGNENLSTGAVSKLNEKNLMSKELDAKTNDYTKYLRSVIWKLLKVHQNEKFKGKTLKSPEVQKEIDIVIRDIKTKASLLAKVAQTRYFKGKEENLKDEVAKLVQKDTHNNFNPKEMVFQELGEGVYKILYKTADSQGNSGPEFEIDVKYDELASKFYNEEVRTVKGSSLKVKHDSVKGRGVWDSGKNGFHNAHILADQLGGAGKNYAANINESSPEYNTRDMKGVEDKVAAYYKQRNKNRNDDLPFNITVSATLRDEKIKKNILTNLLEKEFKKDNNNVKVKSGGVKEIKAKAEDEMVRTLQTEITKDMKEIPARFEKVVYETKGLEKKTPVNKNVLGLSNLKENDNGTDYNNTKRESTVEEEAGLINQTLTIGVDKGYEKVINKNTAFDKNKVIKKLKALKGK